MSQSLRLSALVILTSLFAFAGCSQDSEEPTAETTTQETQPAGDAAPTAGTAADVAQPDTAAADVDVEIVDLEEVAPELSPGDPAPPVKISTWVKGEPVEGFQDDQVYVVEFWATWCGPCLQSMPHMSELQADYGDKVRFIGVSNETEETVSKFMEREAPSGDTWNEVLQYTIALDDQDATNAAYMQAARQGGIPCAFIVGKSGQVEWIGHPMTMEEPLQQVVDGDWDTKAARTAFIEEKAADMVMEQISVAANAGEYDKALKILDKLMEQFDQSPGNEQLAFVRMQLLMGAGRQSELQEYAQQTVEQHGDNVQLLNMVSWVMANNENPSSDDLNLAVKAAERAAELTNNEEPNVLDTLATAYYRNGNLEAAIETQKKAVEAAPGFEAFEQKLAEYEAEANGGQAPETTE